MIPDHRRTAVIYARMGHGKTLMASLLANELHKRENLPVIVYYIKSKAETTLPFYDANCPVYEAKLGMSYSSLKRLANHIVVIEDAPAFMLSKVRRACVIRLLTIHARQDNIPTIITTQQVLRIPSALKIELDRRGNSRFWYKLSESRNTLGWKDWTNSSNAYEIAEAFYKGVVGRSLGMKGRPINPESKQQKYFALFEKGLTPRMIVRNEGLKSGSREYDRVFVYYRKWKMQRRNI